MQTRGVLLLFCTSAYWVLIESFPTTTMNNVPYDMIKEILHLLNKTSIFTQEQENVSLPLEVFRQECCQRNLVAFIDTAQKISATAKENHDIENIRGNLEGLQKFSLPECLSQECNFRNATFPFEKFKDQLESFLNLILQKKLVFEEDSSQA